MAAPELAGYPGLAAPPGVRALVGVGRRRAFALGPAPLLLLPSPALRVLRGPGLGRGAGVGRSGEG
eukprot:2644025-Alexandrium_andersonii.AAC.1